MKSIQVYTWPEKLLFVGTLSKAAGQLVWRFANLYPGLITTSLLGTDVNCIFNPIYDTNLVLLSITYTIK